MNYTELVQLWDKGRKKWLDYGFEVGGVASFVHNYFLDKLEINTEEKKKYLLLIPLKETDSEKLRTTLYAPYACVEFVEQGWANVGLLLLIEKNKYTWPKKQFLFTLSIKKQKEEWLLRISENGKEHHIKVGCKHEDLDPLWNEFVDILEFQTVNQLENWLESK